MFLKNFAGICACVCLCVSVLKSGWGGGGLYFLEYELSRLLKLLFWGGRVEWGGLIQAARAKHNFCEGFAFLCL